MFFGSAITGAGVDALMAGITELLPAAEGDPDGPRPGTVFKIERGPAGEKVAYVADVLGDALHGGTGSDRRGPSTRSPRISVFEQGAAVQRAGVSAGEIGKLWGLGEVRIGDAIGAAATRTPRPLLRPADARGGRRARAIRATRARCTRRWPSLPSRTR